MLVNMSKLRRKKSSVKVKPKPIEETKPDTLVHQISITTILLDSDKFVKIPDLTNKPSPEPDCWAIDEEERTASLQKELESLKTDKADLESATIEDAPSIIESKISDHRFLEDDMMDKFSILGEEDEDELSKQLNEDQDMASTLSKERETSEKPAIDPFVSSCCYEKAVSASRVTPSSAGVVNLSWAPRQPLKDLMNQAEQKPCPHVPPFQMKTLALSIATTTQSMKKPPGMGDLDSITGLKSPKKIFGAGKLMAGLRAKRSDKDKSPVAPQKLLPDMTTGFDEAYIRTWSQPILNADTLPFRITFKAPEGQVAPQIKAPQKKMFPRKSSQTLSKSRGIVPDSDTSWSNPGNQVTGVTLSKEEEENWVKWREVQDRVVEWMKTNDSDNSHITSMLEPEGRRMQF